MRIVGTKNANNLVSVSTDGQLCVWSLENLIQPQEVLTLQTVQSKSAAVSAVAATSLAFPENEVNNFFVGSEDGSVYQGIRHGT
jgi:dynein intermediate chain